MTQIISTDENNDWYLGSNKSIQIDTGITAVLGMCEHAMKVLRGELVFNTGRGVLSFEANGVLGNTPDLIFFDSRARQRLLQVTDVTGIQSLDAETNINNELVYSVTIETIYGTGTITG